MASTEFLEDIALHLNANVFTRTFSFSSAQLPVLVSPPPPLADRVVLVDGVCLVMDLCERKGRARLKSAEIERWFANEVLRKGVDRIRHTRDLLRSYDGISLVNSRGHRVSVAPKGLEDVSGLILHRSPRAGGYVPPRFRKSRKTGFVHIMRDSEYFAICEHLVTPSELADYLKFRREILSRPFPVPPEVSEAALLGQYLFEELDAPADARYETAGRTFRGDPNAWAFSYVLQNLSTQIAKRDDESVESTYQRILAELARLGRSELRELKTQLRLSLEAVRADRFELPYRVTCTSTRCCFLVLPGSAEFRLRAREALESLAVASKYELGLEKQVSIAMWRSGEIIDIDWLYAEGPNVPDETLDKRLEHAYPFRRTSEKLPL
ncbi:MAG: hypothetical protein ACXW2A_19250 [Burkholderiales bacterium]